MLQAERLLTALCKANVEFVVIGGMAAVAQGSAYVTADLDICYQREAHNYQRFSQALQSFKPRLRGVSDDLPFLLDAPTLKAGMNFTLATAVGDLDLIGEVPGLGVYEVVQTRAEEVELYRFHVQVLTKVSSPPSKPPAVRKIFDSSPNCKPCKRCAVSVPRTRNNLSFYPSLGSQQDLTRARLASMGNCRDTLAQRINLLNQRHHRNTSFLECI